MDDKRHLRLALRGQRARRSAAELATAGEAIATQVTLMADTRGTVACYASIDAEPPTGPMTQELLRRGCRVLLPVLAGEDLDWAELGDPADLHLTAAGLREPGGPRLGQDALADCDLIFVPALAVDRLGRRLGRGRGFYDRALARLTGIKAIAVVFTDEVLDEVPAEDHDQLVAAALTPDGLVELGSD
jgi:5-formyltetrahydrofolate cyclo-ligase